MTFHNMPNYDIVYKIVDLKDGNNKEMNVDGSITPAEFCYKPLADKEKWFLESIGIFILDPGDMTHSSFGSITALANGLELKVDLGEEVVFQTFKDNVDILMAFPHEKISGHATTGFLSEEDYFQGIFKLPSPIALHKSDGDCVKAIINDDLTSIGRLRMNLLLWRSV